MYLMELDHGRIEFNTARLLSQKAVSIALAGKANRVIPSFNKKQWQQLTQMMLDACTVDVAVLGRNAAQVYRNMPANVTGGKITPPTAG